MRLQQRLPGALPRKQRGVAMVFTAAFILAAVAALALAIDVGRLYAAQQRLQTAANLAALDTARYVGGCRPLPDDETLQLIAQDAVARNFDDRGEDAAPPVTRLETGSIAIQNDIRSLGPTPANGRSSAVALTVTDNSFRPLFVNLFGTAEPLRASAGAANRPQAQIGIGSTLAGINPNLLAQLLPIDIGAAQQGDLADVPIALADLLDIDAAVATRQQLLETSINDALHNIGDSVSGQVAGLVDQIADLFPADANQASLLDILDIAGEVGTELKVNAGAIVNAAAQLAASSRHSAVSLPLNVNVPGIANVAAKLSILEPPVLAAGPPGQRQDGSYFTEAKTAQVGLELSVSLASLPILGLSLLDLPIVIQGARAQAKLTNVSCASSKQLFNRAEIDADSDVVKAGIGHLSDTDGDGDIEFDPGSATIVKLFGIKLLGLSGQASVLPSAAGATFDIRDPEDDLPTTAAIGGPLTTQQLLGGLLSGINLTPNVLGILPLPLNQLLQPINSLLAGPLASALTPVLDPILQQLGVSLGTGEAQLIDLDVDQPQLFCTSNEDCFGSS